MIPQSDRRRDRPGDVCVQDHAAIRIVEPRLETGLVALFQNNGELNAHGIGRCLPGQFPIADLEPRFGRRATGQSFEWSADGRAGSPGPPVERDLVFATLLDLQVPVSDRFFFILSLSMAIPPQCNVKTPVNATTNCVTLFRFCDIPFLSNRALLARFVQMCPVSRCGANVQNRPYLARISATNGSGPRQFERQLRFGWRPCRPV